jgi:hypothetical protein
MRRGTVTPCAYNHHTGRGRNSGPQHAGACPAQLHECDPDHGCRADFLDPLGPEFKGKPRHLTENSTEVRGGQREGGRGHGA